MKTISGYFNRICKQKYSSLGFYRYGSLGFYRSTPTFVRISNDVIQAFALKRYRYGSRCSVEFGVFPLCLPQPVFFFAGGYMLDQFIVEQYEKYDGWTFDASSEDSIICCINLIMQAIDSYLLPFFETCCDSKSSLSALIKLEELFDENRQEVLRRIDEPDCAVSWQERSLFDDRKYFMALKSRELTYARKYLKYKVEYCQNSLKSFDSPNSPKQPDIVIERFLDNLSLHLKHLEWLDSGDFTPFDEMLKFNEKEMHEFLVSQKIINK